MEDHINEIEETNIPTNEVKTSNIVTKNNNQQIVGAIVLAGVLIAGAILLKGNGGPSVGTITNNGAPVADNGTLKISSEDKFLGNKNAKVTLVMYEDFQCPFCGKFDRESEQMVRNTYVADGRVKFVYRDFAFLGPESIKAAEAARCAGDQGKFWEYHDYLFSHQNGENQGGFADPKLKSFAVGLGLNASIFDLCLDGNKYTKAVSDETTEGGSIGVRGTPKGFILKNDKIVDTIDGAIPLATVTAKLDAALK